MGFHVPPGGSGHGPPFAPQNPTGSINVYFLYALVIDINMLVYCHIIIFYLL